MPAAAFVIIRAEVGEVLEPVYFFSARIFQGPTTTFDMRKLS
jgi:hypothetical protein